jgi:tryptophanyl-tRNA synthetase
MLTEIRCASEPTRFCTAFQERRAKVIDKTLDIFMTPRPLLWRGEKTDIMLPSSEETPAELRNGGDGKTPGSKNQEKKLRVLQCAADITVGVLGVDV